MKTIEEASHNYKIGMLQKHTDEVEKFSENIQYFTGEDIEDAYRAGVEFAQRWIPVEERLPEYKGERFPVLVKDKEGCIELWYINGEITPLHIREFREEWRPVEYSWHE